MKLSQDGACAKAQALAEQANTLRRQNRFQESWVCWLHALMHRARVTGDVKVWAFKYGISEKRG